LLKSLIPSGLIRRLPYASSIRVNGERRFVYVLRSDRDPARHYVGVSCDVRERFWWHNAGLNVHTAPHRPWHVIVSLEFRTEKAALQFERYLKTGSGRAFAKRHFP
jgi:predicted GIY-YIG superfamily endonuclease